jgi:hypothetical protein
MKKHSLLSLLAAVLIVCAASVAQASAPSGSLIVNGSFEDPVIAGSFRA